MSTGGPRKRLRTGAEASGATVTATAGVTQPARARPQGHDPTGAHATGAEASSAWLDLDFVPLAEAAGATQPARARPQGHDPSGAHAAGAGASGAAVTAPASVTQPARR